MPKFRLKFKVGDAPRIGDLRSLIKGGKVIIFYERTQMFGEPLAVLYISEAVEVEGPRTYRVEVETIATPFFLGPTDSIAVF